MNCAKWKARLTLATGNANTPAMISRPERMARGLAAVALGLGALGLASCVNVNAPAEPIVIELNVNIKQEVLYRLVDSANENMEANPEIF